jgi:ribosomal protein S18 acetylase RimI-like enzyme
VNLPPQSLDLALRPIRTEDRDFLFRLYASTREEELRAVPWTPEQRNAFLRQQFEAQDAHYLANYPGATLDLVLLDGQPVGRLYVARWTSEIRIMDVIVLADCRGAGIGTRLLHDILEEAELARKKVSIHVESYNPARRLYERLGFVPAGEHGVYVLMERPSTISADAR